MDVNNDMYIQISIFIFVMNMFWSSNLQVSFMQFNVIQFCKL